MKKAISARIDEDTLTYIKGCHEPVNTLINVLLKKWVKERQNKELLAFQEETGTNELSLMKAKENFKCNQSCNNCIYNDKRYGKICVKNNFNIPGFNFCCIYWNKKKGSH